MDDVVDVDVNIDVDILVVIDLQCVVTTVFIIVEKTAPNQGNYKTR